MVLAIFYNSSFGMMRLFTRKPTPPRQYQQLSPQQKRMVQTTSVSATTKTSPSFYARMQQKFNELKTAGWNTWANLKNMLFKAPVITSPQSVALQQPLAEPFTISMQIIPTIPIPMDHTKLKQSKDIEQEIAPVLKAIELSKENLPEKEETGLMVCTPPGIEIDYISALESFDAIINFIKTLKIKILTDAGLNRREINNILLQLDTDQKYIYENAYTISNKPVLHDTTLDPNILQEIIIKLKQARINPLCVNILNKSEKEMKENFGFASAIGPLKVKDHLLESTTLIFSQELINNTTRETVAFVIGHEIGHLILCHSNALHWIKQHITEILRKKHDLSEFEKRTWIFKNNESIEIDRDPLSIEIEETVNHALLEIKTLFELEADITYSLYDKNIAESSLMGIQARISSGRSDTATMLSDIHQSTNMRYHWLKRIHDLHKAQEAAAKE